MRIPRFILAASAASLSFAIPLHSQTHVSGTVSGVWSAAAGQDGFGLAQGIGDVLVVSFDQDATQEAFPRQPANFRPLIENLLLSR